MLHIHFKFQLNNQTILKFLWTVGQLMKAVPLSQQLIIVDF